MKKTILVGLIVACLIASFVSGCAKEESPAGEKAPILKLISVNPASAEINVYGTMGYWVTATYSDGSTRVFSAEATWESSEPTVATVSPEGLATGKATGNITIIATLEGKSGSATLRVSETATPTVTIVDSAGRYVTLPYPVEKAVVLHSDAAKVTAILGAEEQVVGICSDLPFPPSLKDKPEVGKWSAPSFESIVELEPDLVICYGYQATEFEEQLKPSGIPLAAIDCYKMGTFIPDVKTMGLIFGKENRAKEYADFVEGYVNLVEERVKTLNPEEKVKVYIEKNNKPYESYSVGSGMHDLVTKAGGINIAAGEPVPYPQLRADWVLEQKPEVVVTYFYGPYHSSGYGSESSAPMEGWRNEVLSRDGWGEFVPAAEEGKERVYCLSSHICFGTSMPVGLCYLAKWFYPDLFPDLDPEAIHSDFMTEFMNYEPEGVFAYPGP